MRTKNPVHPGVILKAALGEMNITNSGEFWLDLQKQARHTESLKITYIKPLKKQVAHA